MHQLNLVYYSPTSTTQKIVHAIARHSGLELATEYNITKTDLPKNIRFSSDTLTLFALPVYAGRIPLNTVEILEKLKSQNAPAVIIVVYGNRHYDDALLELKDIVVKNGFKVIAGAAFIGEHSYSTHETPIAHQRPDNKDYTHCKAFAQLIKEQLHQNKADYSLNIPGNYPYKKRNPSSPEVYPITLEEKCTKCGICVDVCPTNAIKIVKEVLTNGEACTKCCACIKDCPEQARIFDHPKIGALRNKLLDMCAERKEPTFFI